MGCFVEVNTEEQGNQHYDRLALIYLGVDIFLGDNRIKKFLF